MNIIIPTPNTVNKVHLFVTFFAFAPAPQIDIYWQLYPDARICTQKAPIHLDSFLASINIVPRHCASALNNFFDRG